MAAVVEPVLSEEKLKSLLAEGYEQECLDFKTTLDLSDGADLVALVKDIAAMLSNEHGGYIVVGVDDDGKPMSTLTPHHVKLFDESRLRSKLEKYITEPFDVQRAHHVIDGCSVILVYVAPNPNGFYIFSRNGEYEVTDCNGKKKKCFEFRAGEVYVRRGTASQPWDDTDRQRLIAAIVARHREQWRVETRDEMLALVNVGLGAQRLEQLPIAATTWNLDAEAFDQLVLELIRRSDQIPLRHLLLQVVTDAAAMPSRELTELSTLMARVTSVAALALTYEQGQWFARALDAMVRIYEDDGPPANQVEAANRKLLIASRIYALGGLAVRVKNWRAVRRLADRRIVGADFGYYRTWLQHAIVRAVNANLLNEPNLGIIGRAHNVIREIAALRPDTSPESERVLDSLCLFDALTGVVLLTDQEAFGARVYYYPNFARYYARRTEPVFTALVHDSIMRQEITSSSDERVAEVINKIDQLAQRAGFACDGWEGFGNNELVTRFLSEHALDVPKLRRCLAGRSTPRRAVPPGRRRPPCRPSSEPGHPGCPRPTSAFFTGFQGRAERAGPQAGRRSW